MELNFELHGKGCEYLGTCDFLVFYFLIHLQKSKKVFTLSLWGIVCRILRKKNKAVT